MSSHVQTWSAGFDATVMQTSYGSITTAPGGSAVYPSVIATDEIDLSGGQLVHWSGGSGDWSNTQWAEEPWPSGIDGTKFSLEIRCAEALAQAFTDAVEMNFYVMQPKEPGGNHPNRSACALYVVQDTGSTWKVILGYYLAPNPASEQQVDSFSFDTGDIIGSPFTLKVCGDVTAQIIRVFFNGVEIYTVSAAFTTKTTAGTAELIAGFIVGDGLPGPLSQIALTNAGCTGDVPQDTSTPCCSGGEPTGTSAGAPVEDPEEATQPDPIVRACDGGGTVDAGDVAPDGDDDFEDD